MTKFLYETYEDYFSRTNMFASVYHAIIDMNHKYTNQVVDSMADDIILLMDEAANE